MTKDNFVSMIKASNIFGSESNTEKEIRPNKITSYNIDLCSNDASALEHVVSNILKEFGFFVPSHLVIDSWNLFKRSVSDESLSIYQIVSQLFSQYANTNIEVEEIQSFPDRYTEEYFWDCVNGKEIKLDMSDLFSDSVKETNDEDTENTETANVEIEETKSESLDDVQVEESVKSQNDSSVEDASTQVNDTGYMSEHDIKLVEKLKECYIDLDSSYYDRFTDEDLKLSYPEFRIYAFNQVYINDGVKRITGNQVYDKLSDLELSVFENDTSLDRWSKSKYRLSSFDKESPINYGKNVDGLRYFTNNFYLEDRYLHILTKTFIYNALCTNPKRIGDISYLYRLLTTENSLVNICIKLLSSLFKKGCYLIENQNPVENKLVNVYGFYDNTLNLTITSLGYYIYDLVDKANQMNHNVIIAMSESLDIFCVDDNSFNNFCTQSNVIRFNN